MRCGWLAKMSDLPTHTPTQQAQGSYGEPMASNRSSAVPGQGIVKKLLYNALSLLKKSVMILRVVHF